MSEMANCCGKSSSESLEKGCPECGRTGRKVEGITLKALLRPTALPRLSAREHRFCTSPECAVVYFGEGELFFREDVLVPVFQKEPEGERTVCYCFAVSEGDIRSEVESSGRSKAADRIKALVQAERCACEVRNPQGSCCLGNVTAVAMAAEAVGRRGRDLEVEMRRRVLLVLSVASLLGTSVLAADGGEKSLQAVAAGITPAA